MHFVFWELICHSSGYLRGPGVEFEGSWCLEYVEGPLGKVCGATSQRRVIYHLSSIYVNTLIHKCIDK